MAVTNENSAQVAKLVSVPKVELSVKERDGRVRIARFDFTQGAAAGDANSTQNLLDLPAGARLLANLSFIQWDAFGAARVLDIGLRAHKNAQTGATIAENATAINSAIDVAAAGRASLAADANGAIGVAGDTLTVLGEARVFSTVTGGTIPAATKLRGDFAYVVD